MDRLNESFIGRKVYSIAMANNLKKTFERYIQKRS
jgi:hypothetical protein